ncbi:MAG: glycosyltransferase [Candidatus Aminicenantia bacterium]
MEKVKVALIHDWLTGRRGGEKVLEVLAEIFPEATIYTLFRFPGSQIEEIEKRKIITSFIQKFPFLKRKYRYYLPLFPLAVELFNLEEYDLVISSSHCVAKGVIPNPEAFHICYVHTPMRYAWNQYFHYFGKGKISFFSRLIIPPIISYLRLWDESSAQRVDCFIANSKNVAHRIKKYYRREAEVIHPPVDTDFFKPSNKEGEYYLIVSALVPYKRIDLAISAFNQTKYPLKIVGVGPEYKKLKEMSNSNIEFLKSVTDKELLRLYQSAKAFLLPGEEDLGIAPLEAQACGTPVIAYQQGGAKETVTSEETGVFFDNLKTDDFLKALDKFNKLDFNKAKIRENAMRFSRDKFKIKIKNYIDQKYTQFRKNKK